MLLISVYLLSELEDDDEEEDKNYNNNNNINNVCRSNDQSHGDQEIWMNKQTPWPESASEIYRPSDRKHGWQYWKVNLN
jgi:polygalacturonase